MNDELRLLATRKQLLVARSRLHRLELIHETRALRRSMARPATWLSIGSPAARPLFAGALMLLIGRHRLSRLLRVATAAIAIARVVLALRR
jgi:hypothetical protein